MPMNEDTASLFHLFGKPSTCVTGIPYTYSDGGRFAAGYKGSAQDCVARAIAIAFEQTDEYKIIYHRLAQGQRDIGLPATARNGIRSTVSAKLLKEQGARFTDIKKWKRGLMQGDFPKGRFIVVFKGHFAACIDGCVYDTHDPTVKRRRNGAALPKVNNLYGVWDCNDVDPITLRPGEIRIQNMQDLLLAANQAPRERESRP